MQVVDISDEEIQAELSKNRYDFSQIKAVVHTRDIDLVLKRSNGQPMVGMRDECTTFMSGKFAINPKAPIIMRDVRMITENGKILFGNIT